MSKKRNEYIQNIAATILGGIGLLISTLVLNAMFSTPPSRAEFDSHKAKAELHLRHIDATLIEIKEGQIRLINHIIKEGKK